MATKKNAANNPGEGKASSHGEGAMREIEQRGDSIGREHLPTRPGIEEDMQTAPIYDDDFPGAGRLKDKRALITGGDSGIGRAVAIAYAKEGARVAIVYHSESEDAQATADAIKALGGEALLIPGDVGDPDFCKDAVKKTVKAFGGLDILINNAAEQHPQESIADITPEQLERTFRTNLFGMFYLVQAALKHMKKGASIINTGSVTAYEGHETLLDYAATKGAIATFTRSLAQSLAKDGIRVNQVAPGPIWTPLIPSTFEKEKVAGFGQDTPLERPGQPIELAEAYIFLAWERASSYITGHTIHINGGRFMTT